MNKQKRNVRYVRDIVEAPRAVPLPRPPLPPPKKAAPEPTALMRVMRFWRVARIFLAASLLFIALPSFAALVSAFEAHVVNVTATLEPPLTPPPPKTCDARSQGYWANKEGCSKGTGSSVWASQINALSPQFSGVFATSTGPAICSMLWTPNCPSGNTVAAKRCRATSQTLADESNIVAGHLDVNALIAKADDGNSAFNNLGLTPFSTVGQSLTAIEAIIANSSSTTNQLSDAAYVAERIIAFYEDENPSAPYCITDPNQVESRINHGGNDFINSSASVSTDDNSTSSGGSDGNGNGKKGNDDDDGGAAAPLIVAPQTGTSTTEQESTATSTATSTEIGTDSTTTIAATTTLNLDATSSTASSSSGTSTLDDTATPTSTTVSSGDATTTTDASSTP